MPLKDASEIVQLKNTIDSKNVETIYLQEKLEQQKLEITKLRNELENQQKSFFFRIALKIKNLFQRKSINKKNNVYCEPQNLIGYPQIVLIKASHLFDADWYLTQYKDVATSGMEPAQHYLHLGAKKGYNPGPNFSTRDYLALYSDVEQMNPLLHYEMFGKAEGRSCQIENFVNDNAFILDKKILFISGEPDTPGHTYRIARYANAAKAMGGKVLELTVESAHKQIEEISDANMVFIWRAPWSEQLSTIFSAARKANIPIIYDIDDLLIDPNLAKVEIVDGIRTTGSTEKAAENFFELLQTAMQQADYCSATTTFLANYMCSFGKRTFHLPNGYDEQTWHTSRLALRKRLTNFHDGCIRIGYAGGSRTHQKDFAKIADVLARLLRERPNCRLVLFRKGNVACTDIEEFPALVAVRQQIEWRELVPLKDLPLEMAQFDINLAPLEAGNAFCEAKSELKFFESALVEVPVVASDTLTFRTAIENGKTGFIATDEVSWYNMLSQLLDDAPLRKKIARNAYFSVLWRYGADHRMELLRAMLDSLFYPGPKAACAFQLNLLKAKNTHYDMPIIPEHEVIACYDKLNTAAITVVVPCYNISHFLAEKLESIKDQTLLSIDLVVVDDWSTDNSIEVANQWINTHKDRFNRVLLIKNKIKTGLGLTKNIGFSHAETLFVISLDLNTKLLPNFAVNCLSNIKKTNAAFVYANALQSNGKKHVSGIFDPMSFSYDNYVGGTALIRLSAWAEVGGYDQLDGCEDYDFWCKFVEHGLFGYHVNETLVYQNQVSKSHDKISNRAEIHSRHEWILPSILKD